MVAVRTGAAGAKGRMAAAAALAAALAASGCSFAPDHVRPKEEIPQAWRNAPAEGAHPAPAGAAAKAADVDPELGTPPTSWWTAFRDKDLDALVERALLHNHDLKAAVARIAQAEAQDDGAFAALLPQIGISGSETTSMPRAGVGQPAPTDGRGNVQRLYKAAGTMSWELDLWGKNRNAREAALRQALANRHDREGIALTLTADVASAYFQAAAAQDRIAIAERQAATAERLLKAMERRAEMGEGTRFDVVRQSGAVSDARATAASLRQAKAQALDKLAVLVGLPPSSLKVSRSGLDGLTVPDVPPGLPSTLLERRPDVRKAEENLRAAEANIGVAKAARLPTFALTGERGLGAMAMSAMGPGSAFYSIGMSIVGPILDWGKGAAAVDAAKARASEMEEIYRQVVLNSLRDADDALAETGSYAEQEIQRIKSHERAREAEAMSEKAFVAGMIDLTGLLDVQRTSSSADDNLVQARLGRLMAAVDLCKALGGEPVAPKAEEAAGSEAGKAADASTPAAGPSTPASTPSSVGSGGSNSPSDPEGMPPRGSAPKDS